MMSIGLFQIGILIFFLVVFIGIPAFFAFKLNDILREDNPDARPYRWGYFWAVQYGVIYPVCILLVLLAQMSTNMTIPSEFAKAPMMTFSIVFVLIALVMAAICFAIGWGLYKRHKWTWVLAIIYLAFSTISPITDGFWFGALVMGIILALNCWYVVNRWKELWPTAPSYEQDQKIQG